MVFVRVLKRKDASSIIIAVAMGLALAQFVTAVVSELSIRLSQIGDSASSIDSSYNFRGEFLQPAILFIFQVIVLELFARATIALIAGSKQSRKN